MFSGKSTELIRRIERFHAIGKKVLCINHVYDTRTDKYIKTHNNVEIPAIKTDSLMTILLMEEYKNADVIGIDEGQFFKDLRRFVLQVEHDKKNIIICGLDGDFEREPMGEILSCIPLCDNVIKLKAYDMIVKDGTYGIFTKRLSASKEKILVGAKEEYIAVSRDNYHLHR
jgi:thymidine kinase